MNLKNKNNNEKAQQVLQKERDKKYQPSWNELWFTGYTTHTGKHKKGIFELKSSAPDKARLETVKEAIEKGDIGTQVEDLKKFSKTHVLKLYKILMESRREETIKSLIEHCPKNYHLITDHGRFTDMLNVLDDETLIGLDTETTGLNPFGGDRIVGMSISCEKNDEHFYIPVRHEVPEKQLDPEYVFGELKPYLENNQLKKVLHNAKFDYHFFAVEGIKFTGVVMDTLIAMHILSENEMSYALKNIATKWGKHFGFEDKSMTYEELFGKGGFEKTPLDIGTVYACKDTHLTLNLYKWIMSHLEKQAGLMATHKMENEVLAVTIAMEQEGFNIDLDFAEEYRKKLELEIADLEDELDEVFEGINVASNQQLSDFLFNVKGLPNKKNGSVGKEVLNMLKDEFEGINTLMDYRKKSKLLSTYFEPLPRLVSPIDHRLHGQFKQSGTKTGRYSSSSPNLQNIPPNARPMFKAPEGKLLVGADFSKVEPTILADMTQDDKFLEPFIHGLDIYSSLASNTFNMKYEDCGDGSKVRKMMKTGLLATMYGTSEWTLAKQLGITVEEAVQFLEDFLTSYPIVKQWIDDVHDSVDRDGFVTTMFGRKRRFLGHKKVAERFKKVEAKVVSILGRQPSNIWGEKEVPYKLRQDYWNASGDYFRVQRQSVNAIIQGTGAEIMKKAMVEVHRLFESWNSTDIEDEWGNRWFRKDRDRYKILGTIHDEILMEVPDNIEEWQIERIADAMVNCVELSLELKVDIEIMKRWGEGIPRKEWFENGKNMSKL